MSDKEIKIRENKINELEEENMQLQERVDSLNKTIDNLRRILPDDGNFAVEPRIHSHIMDSLPDDHPFAFEPGVCCDGCKELLHAPHNECMQTWVETGKGNYCMECFWDEIENYGNDGKCLGNSWALNRNGEEKALMAKEESQDGITSGQLLRKLRKVESYIVDKDGKLNGHWTNLDAILDIVRGIIHKIG